MKQSKLLKKLLTGSERSFILVDRDFIIIDASYGVEIFSETPLESILQKDIRDVFPEIVGLEETFNTILLNQITSFEIKGVCRSNALEKTIYSNLYFIGTNEVEEEDKGIVICIEDVTEMMVMSQALLQRINESELLANALTASNQSIDKIISAIADALVVTDHHHHIKKINPATLKMFGYSSEELIGNSITILFKNPQDINLLNQRKSEFQYRDLINLSADQLNIEILCMSKLQSEIVIAFSCSEINDYPAIQDQVSSFVYVGRNVTDLKRKEQELLDARVSAEKSNQAKSIFLANMSHEIRTPMNGVLGMTDLLLSTNLDDRQQDFVENIRLSGNLLLSLINRILDLSKLEQEELELECLPLNLEKCLEEILDLFSFTAHNKGLEINALLEEDLPPILMTDTTRLKQVLVNLVGNALKFTAQGDVLIQVSRDRGCEVLQNPNQICLRFSIIDTGIGITPDNHDKLFKPFSQVEASTNRRFGGTGLGLAISRQLVELMNGEIGILSPVKDGQGTCFWFRIPCIIPSDSAVVPQFSEVQRNALCDSKILVVEENQNSRNAIRSCLQKFSAEVIEAKSIAEAIAYLDSTDRLDVVLIDWRLVDAHSAELIKQLHYRDKFAELPFLVMANANQQNEMQTLTDQGFWGYVTKPFKAHRLLKTIADAIVKQTSSVKEDVKREVLNLRETENSNIQIQVEQIVDQKSNDLQPSSLKILLAEDNIVNQKVMMAYLSKIGCKADLAENGQQVLQLMQTQDYDVILMDCQMPILDGYAATQAIRQLEKNSSQSQHVIIIAMTANAFTEDRDYCLEIGMDDFVSKPIRMQQLKEILEKWSSAWCAV
ncbi:response regulator [Pseudanabaena biceps]|nr:response regulator [Pseudanabaena biceps]